MSQTLITESFGKMTFGDVQWMSPEGSIGILDGGGYAHLSGHPITKRGDIERIVPPGPDRDRCLHWFDTKDIPLDEPLRKIIVTENGALTWDDDDPIKQWDEIVTYCRGNVNLLETLASIWFKMQEKREDVAAETGQSAAQVLESEKPKYDPLKKPGGHSRKMGGRPSGRMKIKNAGSETAIMD